MSAFDRSEFKLVFKVISLIPLGGQSVDFFIIISCNLLSKLRGTDAIKRETVKIVPLFA
jgi:hypothetical protein